MHVYARRYGFREERAEVVQGYMARVFNVAGINLESRTRRDHLTPDDIRSACALTSASDTESERYYTRTHSHTHTQILNYANFSFIFFYTFFLGGTKSTCESCAVDRLTRMRIA